MFASSTEQRFLSDSSQNKMPSYFHGRTIGSSDLSRHFISSGYHSVGASAQFTPVDASKKRGKNQQGQGQSCQPSVTSQGLIERGHDPTGSAIPPPRHTYDNPSFRCPRCVHPFVSQADLDHHSFVCGAASLLTGMFTPYSAQRNGQYQQLQSPSPTPHGAGSYYQTQLHNQHHHT